MEHESHEPQSPRALARPCSIPHSSPVEWLRQDADCEGFAPPGESGSLAEELTREQIDGAISLILSNPEALGELISRAAPDDVRSDGWTPFCRRLFLQVLAETGQVKTACEYTGLTRQSAYALAARDPLFAAGWDAAAMLARRPLADDIFDKSVNGVTDTISRKGEVIATRHRYDSRLSIAVLNRLDRRCERAEERGEKNLALLRHWDEYLVFIGKGEDEAARALLESPGQENAKGCQPCQVAESGEAEEESEISLDERFWKDRDGVWMTDFPPAAGFTGHEDGDYGEEDYERECSDEEIELLEAYDQLEQEEERAEDERTRDCWLAAVREGLGRSPSLLSEGEAIAPNAPGAVDAPRPCAEI